VDEAVVVRLLELHGAYVDGMAEPEYAPLPEPEPADAPEPEPAATKAARAK
jgi:hypothetical protein